MSRHRSSRPNLLKEIALLIETDSSWGRDVIRGVADYARTFGPWNLVLDQSDRGEYQSLRESWAGDGIIARISTPLQLEMIVRSGVPAVNVDDLFCNVADVGQVVTDDFERAKMALAHFRERGFEHFAFYAPPSHEYSNHRGVQFVATVNAAGFKCQQYKPGYRPGRKISREDHQQRVLRWLRNLPQPVAILAVDAKRGRQLAEICQVGSLNIPDQVAILAGDNDYFFCELCSPPLSSIRLATRRIGNEAAALLDQMMRGKPAPPEPVLIPTQDVLCRQSTDVMSIDDPTVVQALRFIQTHAYQGIVVEDILKQIPVSRRFLERQFFRLLGRLPGEEIRRLRMQRGRQLLLDSDLSVEQIAGACGYSGATQFGAAFRKFFGTTPLAFRKSNTQG